MTKQERAEWVARGYKDPCIAFREHIKSATARGIPFRLTWEQWWEMWEPHYEKRGKQAGQFVMCRTRDQGAYEAGNVRIDTVRANAEERGAVYREAQLNEGRLPAIERGANRAAAEWVFDRGAWGLDYYKLRKLAEQDSDSFAELVDSH